MIAYELGLAERASYSAVDSDGNYLTENGGWDE